MGGEAGINNTGGKGKAEKEAAVGEGVRGQASRLLYCLREQGKGEEGGDRRGRGAGTRTTTQGHLTA